MTKDGIEKKMFLKNVFFEKKETKIDVNIFADFFKI